MNKPSQISFRPDPGVKYAYDRLLEDLREENPKNRSLNKDLLSNLIIAEYQQRYGSSACADIDKAIDWDKVPFDWCLLIRLDPPSVEEQEARDKDGFGTWEDLMIQQFAGAQVETHVADLDWDDWTTMPLEERLTMDDGEFPYDDSISLPDLDIDDYVQMVEQGAVTPAMLEKHACTWKAVQLWNPPIGSPDGVLAQTFKSDGFVLVRLIKQSVFGDKAASGNALLRLHSQWQMLIKDSTCDIDLSKGQVLEDHMLKTGQRYRLILVDGVVYTETTPCDSDGKPSGKSVIQQVGGKEPKANYSIEEALSKVLKSELRQAEALPQDRMTTPSEKHALEAVDLGVPPSIVEAALNQEDFLIGYKHWKTSVSLKDARRAAFKMKSVPEVVEYYAKLAPPHVGCWEPDGVSDSELSECATVERIDQALGDNNVLMDALIKCAADHKAQGVVGKSIHWGYDILGIDRADDGGPLPTGGDKKGRFDRASLIKFCQNKKVPAKFCLIAIAAFMGNVRSDNLIHAWKTIDLITPTLDQFRQNPNLTRHQAYKALRDLKATGGLKGMRPGTYCSLIYFMRSKQDGYMISPHTAKSVNRLIGHNDPIILVNKLGYPEDDNTANSYELYCRIIDGIGRRLNIPGGQAEEILQSAEGLPWRKHLEQM